MILFQMVFQFLSNFKKLSVKMRIVVITFISVGYIGYDVSNYFQVKQQNIYQAFGLERNASQEQIDYALA